MNAPTLVHIDTERLAAGKYVPIRYAYTAARATNLRPGARRSDERARGVAEAEEGELMAEKTSIAWTRAAFGPAPSPPRDGDKAQARHRVNVLVRTGRLAHPNALACADCGHIWKQGERRHEYDHYLGYAAGEPNTLLPWARIYR